MKRYQNDPRWIYLKYGATCHECGIGLPANTRALYFPTGKRIFCEGCGEPQWRRFLAEAQDEEMSERPSEHY